MLLSSAGRDIINRGISDQRAIELDANGDVFYDDDYDNYEDDNDDDIYDRYEYKRNKYGKAEYEPINVDRERADISDSDSSRDQDDDTQAPPWNMRRASIIIISVSILFFLAAAALTIWSAVISDDVKSELRSSDFNTDLSNIACDSALVPGAFVVGTSMNSSTASVLMSDSFNLLRLVDESITSPSAPVWLSTERTFWLVDKVNDRIVVYDALTRALLEIIFTVTYDCEEPFSPSYNAKASQVWISCARTDNFIVLDASTRSLIGAVDMPTSLQSTHFMGPIVVGAERAVVTFNPDTISVYDNTAMPPTEVARRSISSAEGYTVMWRGDDSDDDDLFVFSSTTETIYRLEWRSWSVKASVAINSQVVDMTTDPDGGYLYAAVSPRHLKTYDARSLVELADGSAGVSESDVTAVAVDVTGMYVTVGDDRGIAQRFDIKDNGAPDFTGSVAISLVSADYNAIGGITRATLGCPCTSCLKE